MRWKDLLQLARCDHSRCLIFVSCAEIDIAGSSAVSFDDINGLAGGFDAFVNSSAGVGIDPTDLGCRDQAGLITVGVLLVLCAAMIRRKHALSFCGQPLLLSSVCICFWLRSRSGSAQGLTQEPTFYAALCAVAVPLGACNIVFARMFSSARNNILGGSEANSMQNKAVVRLFYGHLVLSGMAVYSHWSRVLRVTCHCRTDDSARGHCRCACQLHTVGQHLRCANGHRSLRAWNNPLRNSSPGGSGDVHECK